MTKRQTDHDSDFGLFRLPALISSKSTFWMIQQVSTWGFGQRGEDTPACTQQTWSVADAFRELCSKLCSCQTDESRTWWRLVVVSRHGLAEFGMRTTGCSLFVHLKQKPLFGVGGFRVQKGSIKYLLVVFGPLVLLLLQHPTPFISIAFLHSSFSNVSCRLRIARVCASVLSGLICSSGASICKGGGGVAFLVNYLQQQPGVCS